ncbi:MAG TPA: TonB-dependent receptor [Balneolales bacterium]|nr:TonB-dependent receptor [Balneolales bacterium]
MKYRKMFALMVCYSILFLICKVPSYGAIPAQQNVKVSGKVTDASDGSSLPGVNIVVKGTQIGTATNAKGQYELTVPSSADTLEFSYIGYETQTVPVKGRSHINIALKPKTVIGKEVAVVGYQTEKKADLTGAVSVVNTKTIKNSTYNNVMRSLQGHVAGVNILTDGTPGGGTMVNIRGLSTLGNNSPLYIIDGVPTTSGLSNLDPNDIQSIQVLKDASAASIYGARASNGVIIVTTKHPKNGETHVDVSSSITSEDYATKLHVLNTVQRGKVLWQAAINDGVNPSSLPIYSYKWHKNSNGNAVLDKVIVPTWVSKADGIKAANTNWYNQISQPGLIQNYNVSVSNGTKNGSVYFSLNYNKNRGIIKKTNYNKIVARLNSNYKFLDGKLKIGENLNLSKGRQTPVPSGAGGTPMWLALIVQPILPVHTINGGWAGPAGSGFDDRDNPVRLLDQNQWNKNNSIETMGNVYVKYNILPSLAFKSNFGAEYVNDFNRLIRQRYQSGFLTRNINSLSINENNNLNWDWHNTLQYKTSYKQNHFTFLGGMEMVYKRINYISTYTEKFAIQNNNYFYNDAGTGNRNNGGNDTGFQLFSFFGKVNYNYQNRYLVTGTIRRDGSSRFGSNNRYGIFPAVSVGWRASQTQFIRDNFPFISNLKLRAGWGQTGNQDIANSARFTLYAPNYGNDNTWGPGNGTAYAISGQETGTLPAGFERTQTGNPNLKWSTKTETNVGIDYGFFAQKLSGSIDYFRSNTNNILILPPYLGVIGDGGNQWVNGASVSNHGLEFKVEYQNHIAGLKYDITGTLSGSRDKITKLPKSVFNAYPGNSVKHILGHPMESYFGYVVQGIFQNKQEVQNSATQPGKGVGRLRYKDLNGDGVINSLDQKYIGVNSPKFSYGLNADFSYKHFDLSLFLQGVQGISVYNPKKMYTDFTSIWNGTNYGTRTLNAWTPTHRNTYIPALSLADNNDEARMSTYYIENGSYLKLRSAEIGYTLPKRIQKMVGMRNLRVYVRGENLLTFKDNKGPNAFTGPDPANPNNAYPRPRQISVGFDVKF